jgi:hypothetical protein
MSARRLVPRIGVAVAAATAAVVAGLAGAAPAAAQMPDLAAINGRPLPVADLPAGTVVVRVARQTPANAAAGLDVTATTRAPSGDARTTMAKTGADGRAQFQNLHAGHEFEAVVTVDGERLQSQPFTIPPQGGVRIMLIGGLPRGGAARPQPGAGQGQGGQGQGGQGQGTFRMGAVAGKVSPAPELPKGTLVLEVRKADGQPLVNQPVRLGEIALVQGDGTASRQVKVHPGVTDSAGNARFDDLPTGEAAGYAAVTEHEGLRLSTEPFRMPADTGMRGQILALRRTSDPSVLKLDPQSKLIVQLREEALAVMVGLFFRNTSQEIFDPGENGLLVPFPEGAVNAQEIEGGEPLEVVPGKGVIIKSAIPPDSAASHMTTARFGYILPSSGEETMDVSQPFPVVLPSPFVLVPAGSGLQIEAAGLKPLPDEVDGEGDKTLAFTAPPVAAGGALTLTVSGMPTRRRTGRNVAAALSLLLIAGAVAGSRSRGRGRDGKAAGDERERLIARREQLFAELVDLERERRASGQTNGRLGDRRKDLITKLEAVYRDLAAMD